MIGRIAGQVFHIGPAECRNDKASTGRAEVAGSLRGSVISQPIDGEGDDRITCSRDNEMQQPRGFGAGDVVDLNMWNRIVLHDRDGSYLVGSANISASRISEIQSQYFIAFINRILN